MVLRFAAPVILLLLFAAPADAKRKPDASFACEIASAHTPPVVDHDTVQFRVTVFGNQHGPFEWRIPLFESINGSNGVKVNRVGKVTRQEGNVFLIEMMISDLERTADKDVLELSLYSPKHSVAHCSIPADPIRQIARSALPEQYLLQGSINR